MSTQPSNTSAQPDNRPGLFLDENVGSPVIAAMLRDFEALWHIHSHRDVFGSRSKVLDPEVITECANQNWTIVGADDAMWYVWQELLRERRVRLFTFSNGNYRRAEYLASLVIGRHKLVKFIQEVPGPFCGHIYKNGHVEILRGTGAVQEEVLRRERERSHAMALNRAPA